MSTWKINYSREKSCDYINFKEEILNNVSKSYINRQYDERDSCAVLVVCVDDKFRFFIGRHTNPNI